MTATPPNAGMRPDHAEAREEALGAFSHHLAEAIGQATEMPRETLERAAVDPLYLHTLVSRRDSPEAVSELVASTAGKRLPKWAPPPTPQLIAKAARSLARWAAAGFGQVSAETAQRRRNACLSCPQLTQPGAHPLYMVAGLAKADVCGLCSCAIEKKVMLPTETCPAPSAEDPQVNRWGEARE